MGLDSYLEAERYLSDYDPKEKIIKDVIEENLTKDINTPNYQRGFFGFPVNKIIVEAMYWRKANAIHKWFVDKVQKGVDDCGDYDVDREQIKALIADCEAVLADHDKAETLLPTQGGFFFGPTLYDDWYFSDLKDTVEGLTKVLTLDESDWYFRYHSSW